MIILLDILSVIVTLLLHDSFLIYNDVAFVLHLIFIILFLIVFIVNKCILIRYVHTVYV